MIYAGFFQLVIVKLENLMSVLVELIVQLLFEVLVECGRMRDLCLDEFGDV
jgi:hypothetical protein